MQCRTSLKTDSSEILNHALYYFTALQRHSSNQFVRTSSAGNTVPHLSGWLSPKSLQITNVSEDIEKKKPSYSVGGDVNWCSHCEQLYGDSLKCKNNYHALCAKSLQLCLALCSSVDCREPGRLLCPWESPGKNTGVGCHVLLQGIFLTQGSNPIS